MVVQEAAELALPSIDDAVALQKPDHASVVFEDLQSGQAKKRAARVLRDSAVARGLMYKP